MQDCVDDSKLFEFSSHCKGKLQENNKQGVIWSDLLFKITLAIVQKTAVKSQRKNQEVYLGIQHSGLGEN